MEKNICKYCGAEIEEGVLICHKCGKAINELPKEETVTPKVEVEPIEKLVDENEAPPYVEEYVEETKEPNTSTIPLPSIKVELDKPEETPIKKGKNILETLKNVYNSSKFDKIKKIVNISLGSVLVLVIALVTYRNASVSYPSYKTRKGYVEGNKLNGNKDITLVNQKLNIDLSDPKYSQLDYDGDKLTNAEEIQYKTNPYIKDSDNDGLTDNEEVKIFNSDPNKFSTSGDSISDYSKIRKKLDINQKYNESLVLNKEAEYTTIITKMPDDVESEVKGRITSAYFSITTGISANKITFSNYVGKIKYKITNNDFLLLIKDNNGYKKANNYVLGNNEMIITIKKEDEGKAFYLISKANYERYEKLINGDEEK